MICFKTFNILTGTTFSQGMKHKSSGIKLIIPPKGKMIATDFETRSYHQMNNHILPTHFLI